MSQTSSLKVPAAAFNLWGTSLHNAAALPPSQQDTELILSPTSKLVQLFITGHSHGMSILGHS